MSKKSKSRRAEAPEAAAPPSATGKIIAGIAVVLVIAIVAVIVLVLQGPNPARNPALESAHAPMIGEPGAKVHVVEFLDPACETCAALYPFIKQLMAENPARIRVSIRLVPLHRGADQVAAMIEASRLQDKYWPVLETLLATQDLWTVDHVAQPALARKALANVSLDWARLEADMKSPKVLENLAKDREDASALKVTKTPEYFVNGRQMPTFGREQLKRLVLDEISRSY
ncbi:MAG: thioredoxin domain-containing protein [Betaproteobacteria bacterium]|nr:thioredoxin domain-containing protein [Betaproteobacteria bacterium]